MVLSPAYEPVASEPQYRPSAALARTIALRDVTCTFPCCSTTVCDDEHRVPWPRGRTDAANLSRVSRHHHRAKQAGWTPSPKADGSTSWRAPSGRTYRRPPARPVPPRIRPGARLSEPTRPATPARTTTVEREVRRPVPTLASPVAVIETSRPDLRSLYAASTWSERLARPSSAAETELLQLLYPAPF